MPKKLPLAWFPSRHVASLRQRKVDAFAEQCASSGKQPYFDTWGEAHAWLLKRASHRLAMAVKDVESARKQYERVLSMTAPEQANATQV